jgi:hypothetical protein
MAKKLLPKGALEHAALVQIRSCYGCEDVSGVEIELIRDDRFSGNWRIANLQRPRKDVSRASPSELLATARAVASVQRRLRELYGVDTSFRTNSTGSFKTPTPEISIRPCVEMRH